MAMPRPPCRPSRAPRSCRPRPTRRPARPTSRPTGPTRLADASRGRALGRRRPSSALLGVVPFFAYTTVFLLVPTLVVVVGALLDDDGGFTLGNVEALSSPAVLRALRNSVVLSAATAVGGAVVGGILAYAVSTGSASSVT